MMKTKLLRFLLMILFCLAVCGCANRSPLPQGSYQVRCKPVVYVDRMFGGYLSPSANHVVEVAGDGKRSGWKCAIPKEVAEKLSESETYLFTIIPSKSLSVGAYTLPVIYAIDHKGSPIYEMDLAEYEALIELLNGADGKKRERRDNEPPDQ